MQIEDIYNGKLCLPNNTYIVEFLGDLPRYLTFDKARYESFEDALKGAEKWAGKPDPEDDRILIWEVLPSGHKKVVWHFSGWHWLFDEFGEQGKYIGHDKPLYEECMDDF